MHTLTKQRVKNYASIYIQKLPHTHTMQYVWGTWVYYTTWKQMSLNHVGTVSKPNQMTLTTKRSVYNGNRYYEQRS